MAGAGRVCDPSGAKGRRVGKTEGCWLAVGAALCPAPAHVLDGGTTGTCMALVRPWRGEVGGVLRRQRCLWYWFVSSHTSVPLAVTPATPAQRSIPLSVFTDPLACVFRWKSLSGGGGCSDLPAPAAGPSLDGSFLLPLLGSRSGPGCSLLGLIERPSPRLCEWPGLENDLLLGGEGSRTAVASRAGHCALNEVNEVQEAGGLWDTVACPALPQLCLTLDGRGRATPALQWREGQRPAVNSQGRKQHLGLLRKGLRGSPWNPPLLTPHGLQTRAFQTEEAGTPCQPGGAALVAWHIVGV